MAARSCFFGDSSNLKIQQMPSGGARPNTGGKRPGAGRKPLKTTQQLKEELQKMIPQALVAINKDIAQHLGHKGATSAWRLMDKFVPDLKSTEIKNEEGKTFEYRIVPVKELPGESE